MFETELKFLVEPKAAEALAAAWRGRSRVETIESRYFDSEGGALAAAGVSLRLRRRGRRWEQTLKLPAGGGVTRREDSVPRPGRFAGGVPEVDLALHAADAVRAALAAAYDDEDAEPPAFVRRFTSVVRRRVVDVVTEDARIEVALDRGELSAATGTAPICEVELELKAGAAAALVRLAQEGIARHGLALCTVSKAERGDRLARGVAGGPARKAKRASLHRRDAPSTVVRALLGSAFDAIAGNASEIALGEWSAEHVHQLRVAIRRLRTVVRDLGDLDADLDSRFMPPLAQAFRALGAWRDRTHVAEAMRAELGRAEAPEAALRPPRAAGEPPPPTVVRGAAFQEALVALAGAVTAPAAEGDAASAAGETSSGAVLDAVARRLDRLQRRVRRASRDFERLDDAGRHRVRKQVKRLRYLADMLGSLYRPREVKRYLAALEPAQEALGAYVDVVVAGGMARAAAESGHAASWYSAGWLAAQKEPRARACAKALREAAAARPFWRP